MSPRAYPWERLPQFTRAEMELSNLAAGFVTRCLELTSCARELAWLLRSPIEWLADEACAVPHGGEEKEVAETSVILRVEFISLELRLPIACVRRLLSLDHAKGAGATREPANSTEMEPLSKEEREELVALTLTISRRVERGLPRGWKIVCPRSLEEERIQVARCQGSLWILGEGFPVTASLAISPRRATQEARESLRTTLEKGPVASHDEREALALLKTAPMELALIAGICWLPARQLAELLPGTRLLLCGGWKIEIKEDGLLYGEPWLMAPAGQLGLPVKISGDLTSPSVFVLANDELPTSLSTCEILLQPLRDPAALTPTSEISMVLAETPVLLRVELARIAMPVGEWAALAPGAILPLRCPVSGVVTLSIEGQPIATGELCEVEGELAVWIRSKSTPTEPLATEEVESRPMTSSGSLKG